MAGSLPTSPIFDDAFRAQLHQLFVWRRDVRHFRSEPLPDGTLESLIEEACLGPSVGLSQPWRFVIVDEPARRMAVIASYRRANSEALQACDAERRTLYARLKLAGLEEAPSHLAVFVDEGTAVGHGLGLRTMPEMLRYSAVTAVGHMWLAARARGIGMGWISIIEPAAVAQALQVSPEWTLIGYFCLGFPSELCTEPELAREGWERRLSADAVIVRR